MEFKLTLECELDVDCNGYNYQPPYSTLAPRPEVFEFTDLRVELREQLVSNGYLTIFVMESFLIMVETIMKTFMILNIVLVNYHHLQLLQHVLVYVV